MLGVGVELQLSTRVGRSCTVVQVGGELDMATRREFQDFVRDVVDAGARQVVFDMAQVPFMDSSGLGALVELLKLLRDRGGRLGLAAAQRQVRTVLELSAIDQVVELYDSVEAAEDDMPPAAA